MYEARVRIALKKGVSDPEGANTLKALRLLGFSDVDAISSERVFHISLDSPDADAARSSAERACRRLLTNPIIHDYSIEVSEA